MVLHRTVITHITHPSPDYDRLIQEYSRQFAGMLERTAKGPMQTSTPRATGDLQRDLRFERDRNTGNVRVGFSRKSYYWRFQKAKGGGGQQTLQDSYLGTLADAVGKLAPIAARNALRAVTR